MLFFYLRHGDPIYDPDSLTELGHKQAEALAKRLALFGIDEIYASTSKRAIETARPTCDLVKKEPVLLDFCNEGHAWRELTIKGEKGTTWLFQDKKTKALFADPSIVSLYDKWYEHPALAEYNFKHGIDRISDESDKFLRNLGYEHIRGTGSYRVIFENNKRVALFAHQGFGIAFLSLLLDIPYPIFSRHFDTTHSGMTVIEFKNEDGICHPKMLTLSNDSHLYRDGLPLYYNREIRF